MNAVMDSFHDAVQLFFDKAYWLTDNEAPAMTSLLQSALCLDNKVTSTMLAEYGKVFRYLRGLKPEDGKVVDDLDALLETL